jgi:hypothetical protein
MILFVLVNVASFSQRAQYAVGRGHGNLGLLADFRQGETVRMGQQQFQGVEVAANV